jgi:MFS family permease
VNDGTEASSLRYAWYVVFVLMTCYTLSFIDRQILALLVGPIRADLEITDTQIGLLGGLAFSLFYTLVGLPIGRLADRHNRRNIIAIGVFFWSIATALCAAARGFWGLFAARTGVGVGEATLGPSAMSIISDYFPKDRLAGALSLYSMGIFIGAGLANIVGGIVIQAVSTVPTLSLPFFGELASWRVTFLVVGLPGVLAALLACTIREPARRNLLVADDGLTSALTLIEVFEQLKLRWQSVIALSAGMMALGMAVYAYLFWSPVFLQRVHAWSPAQTGLALGIVTLIPGCIGMYVGGSFTDRWLGAGIRHAALKVAAIGSGVGGTFYVVGFLVPDAPGLSVILLGLGLGFTAMPTGSCYAALQSILPNQVRGQAVALFLFLLNLGGLTLGPLLPGVFNDYLFRDEAMVGPSSALTTFLACAAAFAIFVSGFRPYARDHELMHGSSRLASS